MNTLNAQISINQDSVAGEHVSGKVIQVESRDNTYSQELDALYVSNNASSNKSWKITRKVINQPEGWTNYLCWGEQCYGANEDRIWSTDLYVVPHDSNSVIDIYFSASSSGNAHLRYYVSSDGINYLDSVDVKIQSTLTSIKEPSFQHLRIYPNPAKNIVNVLNNTNNAVQLSIYNVNGQNVLPERNIQQNQTSIDISTLPNGMYYFNFLNMSDNSTSVQKIIVQP